jgi:hypothetical protein
MAIFATPIDRTELLSTMQKISTKTHYLVQEIRTLDLILSKYSDLDLEEILGGGGSAAAERTALRTLQAALKGFSDNYTGTGSLSDKSTEIAKRVRPLV